MTAKISEAGYFVATGMHADDVVMLVFTEKLKNTNTGNEELTEILDA